MVDNPRVLINHLASRQDWRNSASQSKTIEAVFIPFRGRPSHVIGLLGELSWYAGPIYLLPSTEADYHPIRSWLTRNVQVLHPVHSSLARFCSTLMTSRHTRITTYAHLWDLPIKRNYAVAYARRYGYSKILLIDDDIRGCTSPVISAGAEALDTFSLAGCFVDEYPDTSVVGHLAKAAGRDIHPFLSGSFLFVKPHEVSAFFPRVYNEDWLFMLPHVAEGSVCSFGTICQLPYDPLDDTTRLGFQEFGDIVAEGLYSLVASSKYEYRYEIEAWRQEILDRRHLLLWLREALDVPSHAEIVDAAILENTRISPEDCVSFVESWEQDLLTWRVFLEGAKL